MSVFVEDLENDNTSKKKKKYKTKYNAKYEYEYPWASRSPKGENFATCNWCKVHINIGSVGIKGLRDHEITSKHKRSHEKVQSQPSLNKVNQAIKANHTTDASLEDKLAPPIVSLNQFSSIIPISNTQNTESTLTHMSVNDTSIMRNQNNYRIINKPRNTSNIPTVISETMIPNIYCSGIPQTIVSADLNSVPPGLETTTEAMIYPHSTQPHNDTRLPQTQLNLKQELGPPLPESQPLTHNLVSQQASLCNPTMSVMLDYNQTQPTLPTLGDNNSIVEQKVVYPSPLVNPSIPPRILNPEENKSKISFDEDDLKCDICNEVFTQWTLLKKHLVNHINDIKEVKPSPTKSKISTKKTSHVTTTNKGGRKKKREVKQKPKASVSCTSSEPIPEIQSLQIKVQNDEIKTEPNQKVESKWDDLDSLHVQDSPPNLHILLDDDNDNSAPEEPDPLIKLISVQCRVCKKMFHDRNELKTHQHEAHNKGRPYECLNCHRHFTTKNHLEVHMKHKHVEGPDPLKCHLCFKVLSSKTNLRIHLRVHAGEKPFQCSICQKRFSRKANMEMHKVYHTGERRYTCEVCGQSFFAINALNRHSKLHLDVREFICDECGASYVTFTDLKRHKFKHDDVKPFPCSICDKQFTRAHDLKVHMRYHNKDMKYTCEICNKKFVESGNFNRHMRRHTGERPFKCNVCDGTFSQMHHLKNHMKSCNACNPDSLNRLETVATSNNRENEEKVPDIAVNSKRDASNVCVTHFLDTSPTSSMSASTLLLPVSSGPVTNATQASFIQYNSQIYNHYPNAIFELCPTQQQSTNHNISHQNH